MFLTGESRALRITTFTALYFAQGIPIGLLDIAMPAWLAQQGFADAQVAGFMAVVGLPWAFKLIAGPFMDRFAVPSMGRRRPWVMAAQSGLLLALASLTLVPDPTLQFGVLTAIGFVVNSFAASQDVAVDGMAIDVTPDDEKGRLNAFMAFGQVVGYSAFGGLCGVLLVKFGLTLTALTCAFAVLLILLLVTATREREGDSYFPTRIKGAPSHKETAAAGVIAAARADVPAEVRSEPMDVTSITLQGLFTKLWRVMSLRMSMLFTAIGMTSSMTNGITIAVLPLLAVKELGYASEVYSQTYSLLAIGAACFGLALGPLVDRFGAKSVLLSGHLLGMIVLLAFVFNGAQWSSTLFCLVMLGLLLLCAQANFVGFIAQGMNMCWRPVAATQFAMFMALSNLGRSAGAATYAGLAESISYAQGLQIAAGVLGFGALLLLFFSQQHQQKAIAALD